MAGQQQHHHRASLSQSNKPYKSRFATKNSIKDAAKGRTQRDSPKQAPHTKASANGQRAARRNHAKQIQAQKRRALVDSQRIFSGETRAPRVVAMLGLCEDIDASALQQVVKALEESAGVVDPDGDAPMEGSSSHPYGLRHFALPSSRFKSSSLQFLLLPHGVPIHSVLSTLTGADFLITVLSPEHECSPWGETALRSLQAAGTATGVIGLVSTLEPVVAKEQNKTRNSLLSFLHYFFPPASSTGHGLLLDKIVNAEHSGELANVVRCLAEKAPREVAWREGRARMVAEEVAWEEGDLLKVTGVVRGGPLSVDRLVHVPLLGDFRLDRIIAAPAGAGQKRKPAGMMQTDAPEPGAVLATRDDEEADDLASTNVPSEGADLLNEQTWPTEDEIASAPANGDVNGAALPPAAPGTTPRVVKRVPKGTSAYQAAWLLDEDDEELSEEDPEDVQMATAEGDAVSDVASTGPAFEDREEFEDLDLASGAGTSHRVAFQDLPEDEEAAELEAFRSSRRQREKEEREDAEFPDEIDTPMDVPARERFARYRGLRSFRTSEWDPYENLPPEYARLFAFEDFKTMGRKLLKRAQEDDSAIQPGTRVVLHINGVTQSAASSIDPASPLVVFSLLKHEHKYSAMHFTAQRNTEYTSPVRSKDPLVISVGPRFFSARPIWSQHSQGRAGKGVNNVHKFERFLRPGATPSVGTAYLPVTFGGAPVLVFKEGEEQGMELVATGTALGSDTTRIVAKRIVLTGHPFKVHKKTATIRYLFFNRADVDYFKPIQLKTKKGRTGFVREPLGTHGYFKAGFDGPVDQMDTVCMNLYKRCYPKWAQHWTPAALPVAADADGARGSDVVMS